MGRLSIEPGQERAHVCDHCGDPYRSVLGFVHDGGNPYAIYCAALYDHHPDRRACIAVGLGAWHEGSGPDDRFAIALEALPEGNDVVLSVGGRERSPWRNAPVLGRMMDHEEAVGSPFRDAAVRVADFVIRNDERVRAHLGAGR